MRLTRFRQLCFALTIGAIVFSAACGGNRSPRHVATVSAVTAHATLAAIQDTEMLLVCGRPGAPSQPTCIQAEKHKQLSGLLAEAFDYDGQVLRIVRAMPTGQPQPGQVGELLARIAVLIDKILADLPRDAPPTQALLANLREAKE